MKKLYSIAQNIITEQNIDQDIQDFKNVLHQGMIHNFKNNGFLAPVLFFMDNHKQPHFELIPPQFLSTPEGKEQLGITIKKICTSLNIICAGMIIEAHAKKLDKNKDKELGDKLQRGDIRVSELQEKEEVIIMIFSTPNSEESIGYYVDPKTKTIKEKMESDGKTGGLFSRFFDWRKASMNESSHLRAFQHKWHKVENSRKLNHKECEKCHAEKWWDDGFQKLIYHDRFGKLHYRAPECVIPNTKL
jgi:hypothetical protein